MDGKWIELMWMWKVESGCGLWMWKVDSGAVPDLTIVGYFLHHRYRSFFIDNRLRFIAVTSLMIKKQQKSM